MEKNNGTTFFNLSEDNEKNNKNTENNADNQEQVNKQVITSETGDTTTVFDLSKKEDVEASNKETDDNNKPENIEDNDNKNQKVETDKDNKDVEVVERKSFKIKSNNIHEDKNENSNKEIDNIKETRSISEDDVINFLKNEVQLDVSNIKEISKKQILPDSVKEFKKFVEETGRGHVAFLNAKKDWTKEDRDVTIKEHLKYTNKNLSDEDIQTQLDLLKIPEEEREEMTDREIRSQELEYNKAYSEALAYMQDVSTKFGKPLEQVKPEIKQPTPEEIAEAHRPYWKKRDTSLDNFNEVNIPIEGLGDIKIPMNDNLKDLISRKTQTQSDFFSSWMEKDAKGQESINTDKSVNDVSWSIPEVREYFIEEILSQAHTMFMTQFSKENRNVTIDKAKDIKHKGDDTISVTKTSTKNSSGFNDRMGEPLLRRN